MKVVPKDIKIDATMLMWWYLGDGCLCRKKSRPNYRRIMLATDKFLEEENIFLMNLLKSFLNNQNLYLENNHIFIARDAICNFVNILGKKSPVNAYQYKFEFGQYKDCNYFKNSFKTRPIYIINKYRKKHHVRELDYNQVKKEMLYGNTK